MDCKKHDKCKSCTKKYCKIPKIYVGSTTTLLSNSQTFVVQTGTKKNVILNFGLVRGNGGLTGSQGPVGISSSNTIQYSTSTPVNLTTQTFIASSNSVSTIGFDNSLQLYMNSLAGNQVTILSPDDTTQPLVAFVTPINGNITSLYFTFNITIFTVISSDTSCTLMARYYYSTAASPLTFLSLDGTIVVIITSVGNGVIGAYTANIQNISVPITTGQNLMLVLFFTNNSASVSFPGVSTVSGLLFGRVTIEST